jgi:Zn finger protein HypA/HybF involved in hydrogenase expression
MHDISVAQAVAEAILKRLGGKKAESIEIELGVGQLRFHDPEQVSFWINEILRKETGSDVKVRTSIEVIKPEISCGCGFKGAADPDGSSRELAHHGIHEMRCPSCGSPDAEIEHGDECVIRAVRFS